MLQWHDPFYFAKDLPMLTIKRPFLNQILTHLQNCYPQEGCGLVAGDEAGGVTAVYPINNALQSATAYKMVPQQQLRAMLDLEANGWQLLAIYHSHPQGPEHPSVTDIKQATYPEALTLIVSLHDQSSPVTRLFHILGPTVTEKKMKVVQPSGEICV